MNRRQNQKYKRIGLAALSAGCISFLLLFGGLSFADKPENPIETGKKSKAMSEIMLVDDFTAKTASGFQKNAWTFTGKGERLIQIGVPMIRVAGDVAPKADNGYRLASLDLTREGQPFDASRYAGVRLAFKADKATYAIQLRTSDCKEPGQFYQASIKPNGTWQVATIAFKEFAAHGLSAKLDLAHLTQIGLAGAASSSRVDLSVSRVIFYAGAAPEFKRLSAEEEAIIAHRGTEAPWSGQYVKVTDKGAYTCKRCGTVLFGSSDKFQSECGWPSFDDAIPGTVLRFPDADGRRVEIVCATCGAHLGHVFEGEGLTKKNTRYCVNSLSIDFAKGAIPAVAAPKPQPEPSKTPEREEAIFAEGCFWGTQSMFQKAPGVLETTVGYTGGHTENPTYKEVCTGTTGHAEALRIVFDPRKTTYETLVRLFFETHDFGQEDGQGPDIGDQYRSVIFYTTKEQKATAEKVIQQLHAMGRKVATKVVAASKFWPAEEYHQRYYEKNGKAPYCHFRRSVFDTTK
jgi:peptide methionine sulfoxide reductase msrA/msrB